MRGSEEVGSPIRRDGRAREAIQKDREGLFSPSGELGGVARARKGQEFVPEGRVGSVGPSGWRGAFGRPPKMARRRLESLMEARRGQEAILEGREESGVTFGKPGRIKRDGRGWEPLAEGRKEWGHPGRSGGVRRPFQRARSGREGWEGLGDPSGELGVVKRPS